jgi:FkbM family methyltransferase
MKTPLFERLCGAVARATPMGDCDLIRTNLGISGRLCCEIPLAKGSYVFGRPSNWLSERSTLSIVRELSTDCTDFLDVGANEGVFTFLVSEASPDKKIQLHWFEPDIDLHDRLVRNLEANAIASCGHCVAVANRNGQTTFYKNLSDDSSGSTSDFFSQKHITRTEIVNTITLGEYLKSRAIHDALVKIDVEGSGYDVWQRVSTATGHIKYLVMEMLEPEIRHDLPAKIIEEGAFYAYYIRDFDLVEAPKGNFSYVAPFWNWLFCKMDPDRLGIRMLGTKFKVISAA